MEAEAESLVAGALAASSPADTSAETGPCMVRVPLTSTSSSQYGLLPAPADKSIHVYALPECLGSAPRISRAEPAINDGFNRVRAPFCSLYTLNPRLFASPPVFQSSTT